MNAIRNLWCIIPEDPRHHESPLSHLLLVECVYWNATEVGRNRRDRVFFDLLLVSVMKGICCVINCLNGELESIHELVKSLIRWRGKEAKMTIKVIQYHLCQVFWCFMSNLQPYSLANLTCGWIRSIHKWIIQRLLWIGSAERTRF